MSITSSDCVHCGFPISEDPADKGKMCDTCLAYVYPQRTPLPERLPKDLYSAVQFAAMMIGKGQRFHECVMIAARHYKVDPDDVQRTLAQRSGRSQRGKRR